MVYDTGETGNESQRRMELNAKTMETVHQILQIQPEETHAQTLSRTDLEFLLRDCANEVSCGKSMSVQHMGLDSGDSMAEDKSDTHSGSISQTNLQNQRVHFRVATRSNVGSHGYKHYTGLSIQELATQMSSDTAFCESDYNEIEVIMTHLNEHGQVDHESTFLSCALYAQIKTVSLLVLEEIQKGWTTQQPPADHLADLREACCHSTSMPETKPLTQQNMAQSVSEEHTAEGADTDAAPLSALESMIQTLKGKMWKQDTSQK